MDDVVILRRCFTSPMWRFVGIWSMLMVVSIGPASAQPETLEGVLSVAWGDPSPDIEAPAHLAFHLTDDSGTVTRLQIGADLVSTFGGPQQLAGLRVEVTLAELAPSSPETDGVSTVTNLRIVPPGPGAAAPEPFDVTGSKPWISILCKFSDVATEPENLAYFQDMYGGDPGELDHYWRELSYETIDVVGSLAVDWVDLPQPHTFYAPTPGSGTGANLNALFDDCTAAADAAGVDFSNGGTGGYEGINMMFNGLLDCCAWGGSKWASLDGVTKLWRVTWEPPWGYADEGVIAHEMGHGFGLPHSNNWDNDGFPYDSPWDVMSAATGYAVNDPTYGRLGKHTIAHHKDILGWIAPAERFEVTAPGIYGVTIDHLAVASTPNLRMVRIPIGVSSKSYVVEAREQVGNYDGNLPGNAVLIFEVDPFRSEDAWLVDADVPPAGYSDNEGSMWKVGETFEDLANELQITIDGAAPNGFDVTIAYGVPPTLTTDPTALDFGSVDVSDSSTLILQILNSSTGAQTLLLSSMQLSDTQNFSLDLGAGSVPCGSETAVIASGGFCSIGVAFAPAVEQAFTETLSIGSNASAQPYVVSIDGNSVPCAFNDHVVLPDEVVSDTRTEEACLTLTAGPYSVVAPGEVTLRAGDAVILQGGFSVGAGAALTIELF